MARASDIQVQKYVNERVRIRAERIRGLLLAMEDDKSVIDDVYEALATDPTWTDDRTDGPPHLMTPSDVLAWNTFISTLITHIREDAQLPVVLKACVQPV